ncbi:MAG: Secretion system C-terminal sorting domain [Bacteroidota bacterium]|jgi:hypothetical protein
MKNFITISAQKTSIKSSKSNFSMLLKGITIFFLLSSSDLFAQQLTQAKCFATSVWTSGTYNQGTERKIKVNGIYKVYKVVYSSTAAPLTDKNSRCEKSTGSCTRPWQFVGKCYSSMRSDSQSNETFNEDDEMESLDNTVYPNPFTSTLNVSTYVNSSNVEIELYNLTGEKLDSKTLISDNNQVITTFNTESLSNGIYLVRIIDGNDVITYKVSK